MDFDPNAPAFGPGAPISDPEPQAPEVETEVETPEVKVDSKPVEASEEESKVPYSRFKKFHDDAKRYQAEAEEWKAKAEAVKSPTTETKDDLPDFWVELYGDSEASRKAWKVQSQANSQLIAEARREAVEAVKADARAEVERVETNLGLIDEGLESLNDLMGRDLTEAEQSAVLDIVDDYTPKDADGNYQGAPISFEKAWEIYELKQQTVKTKKINSRNQVASVTNAKTEADTSVDAEKDKSFNPLDWDSYKKRI